MKIRIGFVSNSSSSSFCIYGICIDEEKAKEALMNYGVSEEELSDGVAEYADQSFWSEKRKLKEEGKTPEEIEKIIQKKKEQNPMFSMEVNCPYEDLFIGESWSNIGDNETGSQFKNKIQQQLKKVFGENIKCSTLEEAWRDG